jgi:hypothetical protein
MKAAFYITGSLFCAECGNFLIPELLRDPRGGLTGEVILRKHAEWCSLSGTSAKVRLPQIEALEVTTP